MSHGRPLRPLALATCLVFGAAQLAAWGHWVLAHHGYCSDHGQLIHLDGDQAPPVHDPQQRGVRRASHLDGSHGCLALTFLTTPWVVPRGLRGVSSTAVPDRVKLATGSSPLAAIPPLHLAPKGSPPAV